MRRTITLLLSVFIVGIAQAGIFDSGDLNQAYAYLNKLRVRAGMTEFSQNLPLEIAAFNHANYLADNFLMGHYESEDTPGFTGIKPKDRTIAAGYRSFLVSENVSSGHSNSIDSIDALMGAIYHRLGFLDFVKNTVGIGIAHVSAPNPYGAYVYNMGNFEYNSLCEEPAFSSVGRFYFDVCEPNINIDASNFENVAFFTRGNNPNIVLWPADGDNDVPPAFFEETPDPLPDFSVSGYPISIQFNPLTFTDINVTEFKLYREQDSREVQPTRLLSKSTDPNGKLSALQYVLFPLERLDWDTAYRIEAKYTSNLGEQTQNWRFKTRSVGVPLFTVQGKSEVLFISQNAPAFAIYVPPTPDFPKIGGISYRFQSGVIVRTEFEDGNTLRINLSGKIGQKVRFSFSGGRRFVAKVF